MSTAPTQPDASPHVSPGDSSQSSGAIVPTAGHTDFDGETEARNNTEAAVAHWHRQFIAVDGETTISRADNAGGGDAPGLALVP